MDFVEWRAPTREIGSAEASSFFDAALPETTIFRYSTERFRIVPHTGAFSLKLVHAGQERYQFSSRSVNLSAGHWLLINADQTYSSRIDHPTCSTSIFFRAEDVASIIRTGRETTERLLDNPEEPGDMPYVAQTAVPDVALTRKHSFALTTALDNGDTDSAEYVSNLLLHTALETTLTLTPPELLASICRRATRDEILSRLLRARQCIDDQKGVGCQLDELAAIACLSKYHFLRVFTQAFGQTPMMYARRKRLEVAREALAKGEDIERVARKAGYRNKHTFKRACRRVFGPGGNS